MIPGIVILLQKQWRGYLCRQQYKKMRAALVLMEHYREYKRRIYINELERTFRNAKKMKDYGKHLTWPRENFAVRHVVPALKNMYARWRAWMVLRVIPREDWPQLRLKVCPRDLYVPFSFSFDYSIMIIDYNHNLDFRWRLVPCCTRSDLTGARTVAGKVTTCRSQTRIRTATSSTLR